MPLGSPPGWVADYIGLPFKELGRDRDGVDCWGLVRLVYAERYGIALPSYEGYGGTSAADVADIARLIRGALADGGSVSWRPIAEREPGGPRFDFRRTGETEGDVVVIRMLGDLMHVGLVVEPRRRIMLHVLTGSDAAWDNYDSGDWRNLVVGIYRGEARHA